MEGVKQMTKAQRRGLLNLPEYSLGEEIWNATSHGIGAALSIAALVLLMVFTPKTTAHILSLLCYSISVILVYLVSTIYHALPINQGKKILRIVDHCTIFLMIAGTYTPILVIGIGGVLSWVMLSMIWGVSIIGIILKLIDLERYRKISMVCYLGIGWSCVFIIKPLLQNLTIFELSFLLTGGILYTVGVIFFAKGRNLAYMHTIFHIFVVAASVFHFFSVFSIATRL